MTSPGFARVVAPRLRVAFCSSFGIDVGEEAAAEAMAFAWENWDTVCRKSNPAGYLYGVGRNKAKTRLRGRVPLLLPAVGGSGQPWVEPGLPNALGRLSQRQRTVVMLVYCFEWTLGETARVLGMSKGTVQLHARRGLARLRRDLGVEL